jgi:dihydroflavonol-4-reductase
MVESTTKAKVVITGISGYLGSYVCHTFLQDGRFQIRGTVRDPHNEAKVEPLRKAFGDKFNELELFKADLLNPDSLDKAIEGCDYVVHTASPVPSKGLPKDENVLIRPAVEGTLAVLKAALKHKVKRVVVTSSLSAIVMKNDINVKEVYDENDWSDLEACSAYDKSKTMAERAAWEFLYSIPEAERFELVCINPVFILGPALVPPESSTLAVKHLMEGKFPFLPKVMLVIVDIRECAMAHLKALIVPEAKNKRFILGS